MRRFRPHGRLTDFAKIEALGFEFVGTGMWINKAKALTVRLNEDYKTTYRAYACERAIYRYEVKNKAGNEMRFRTADAAAAYVTKMFPDGGKRLEER